MRLHVVDGTWELYRAHFSQRPPHIDPEGNERKATLGVVNSVLSLLSEENVTHIAVAFDNPIRSFRNDLFAGYKSDEGVPPEISSQFGPVEEGISALGITVWSMDRWECDDALATAAARWANDVDQVRIMSPDKDLGQCIRGTRVVQIDRLRKTETNEDDFRARRGIAPTSMPDWLALVGDTADGIPGLDGFGEKTASALLGKFGHIEDIPDDSDLWPKVPRPAVLASTLRAGRAAAKLYRQLATLVTDVPLAEDLAALEWKGAPRARFEAWCRKIDSARTFERPRKWTA